MKYRIGYRIDSEAVINGLEPYSNITEALEVEADSRDEAVGLFWDYMAEQAANNMCFARAESGDEVTFVGADKTERYVILEVEYADAI